MATFVWSNFGGGRTGYSFYDIYFSFRTGSYTKSSTIGESESFCNCGQCVSCKVNLSDVQEYVFDMKKVHNLKDTSKNEFSVISRYFYDFLHQSLKEIYGEENVIIFGRNLVIKKPSVDIQAIFSVFDSKVKAEGYDYVSNPMKEQSTHFPLQIDSSDREKLLKFLSK